MKMKESIALRSAFMLLLCMTACQKHEVDNLNNEGLLPISISDYSRIQTKVTGSSFDSNDEIGLYVLEQSNTLADERHVNNMRFKLNEGVWAPDTDIFYPEGNPNCRFIAYYPYKVQAVVETSSTITCNVHSNQNETGNYSLSDFLVAEKSSVTPSTEAVSLVFKHKLAELRIELEPGIAYGTAEALLAENPVITIKGVATQVDYDMETGEYTNPGVLSNITPAGEYSVIDGKLTGKHAIVVPQNIAGDHLMIEANIGGRIYSFTFGTTHTIAPATQETYTLTIHKALTQGSIIPSISEWENSSNINGNLDENGQDGDNNNEDNTPDTPVTAEAYKINLPYFNGTSVYKVMNGSIQLAEICREYLSATDINNQAIVVYPVKDGQTDLTNGYAARILDGYAGNALSNSVHGGKVSWNLSDNSLTYQKGNQSGTSAIYIDKDGNITASTQTVNPAELSVTPYYLHDTRDNYDYPVTKIATQYWMAENLHATTLTDGTGINEVEVNTKWEEEYTKGNAACCINASNTFYNYYASVLPLLSITGWGVPESNDFKKLSTYINGEVTLLKSQSWSGTNLTGFTAIETGYRSKSGSYITTTPSAYYWNNNKGGYKLSVDFASAPGCSTDGLCIRCIKK